MSFLRDAYVEKSEIFLRIFPFILKRIFYCFSFIIAVFFAIYFYGISVKTDIQATVLPVPRVSATFSADYVVSVENEADVVIKVRMHNQGDLPTVLTTYSLNLGRVVPEDVRAFQGDQALTIEQFESQGFVVRINLGEVLLRVDDVYEIEVRYRIKDFFSLVGGSYEALLPVFELGSDTGVEYIAISYDKKFGRINYANTDYDHEYKDIYEVKFSNVKDLDFVVLLTGQSKVFGFEFERKFTNETDVFVTHSIIFIPELAGQKVSFTSISPYPENSFVDSVGNLVFNYSVAPGEDLWVRFRGNILYSGNFMSRDQIAYLSSDLKTKFLETQLDWWKLTDRKILDKIENFKSEDGIEDRIDDIYNHVIESLILSKNFRQLHTLDFRKGGQSALNTYKNASAEDFADAFVAICRNVGIPARVVAGYVFPYSTIDENMEMYHVWPQYWNEDIGWVSVDPAYEKHTNYPQRNVGLRRVITSIVEDSIPAPIFGDSTSELFMTNQEFALLAEIESDVELPKLVKGGEVGKGKISLTNRGTSILYGNSVLVKSKDLKVKFASPIDKVIVLPGETITLDFNISSEKWYISGDRLVELSLAVDSQDETLRQEFSGEVKIQALWWAEPASWLITVVFFAIVTGLLYLMYVLAKKTYIFLARKKIG